MSKWLSLSRGKVKAQYSMIGGTCGTAFYLKLITAGRLRQKKAFKEDVSQDTKLTYVVPLTASNQPMSILFCICKYILSS